MFEFKGFDYLTDGEIDLKIEEKIPYDEEIVMLQRLVRL